MLQILTALPLGLSKGLEQSEGGHGGTLPCLPDFYGLEQVGMADPVIELSGVWKIFGPAEQAALAEARAGASKADILARHKCVVGIADA